MRVSLNFNWERVYGSATASIHQMLREYLAIDWFVPPASGATERAKEHLERHISVARRHSPSLFAERLQYQVVAGCWPEFAALCRRVQSQTGWDWKYSALKMLCHEHSTLHGWELTQQGPYCPDLSRGQPEKAELFLGFNESVFWGFSPKLDYDAATLVCQDHPAQDDGWYVSYANMDVTHAIEWQLAEPSASLEDNPFWPLLRCYAEGLLPFSVSREEMILFAFS